jgi:hypothetical protein
MSSKAEGDVSEIDGITRHLMHTGINVSPEGLHSFMGGKSMFWALSVWTEYGSIGGTCKNGARLCFHKLPD